MELKDIIEDAMKLKDTIEGMLSDDYKERFKAEYKQLIIRLDRLETIINKFYDDDLDFTLSCPIELLIDQSDIMERYVEVLRKRASHEGINLD